MHPKNSHNSSYNFEELTNSNPKLSDYLITNSFGNSSIDFSNSEAVIELNKAILKHQYQIESWNVPKGYLCPPIPGRADYIHHISDLLSNDIDNPNIKGLDIGVGANCIYPILGTRIHGWTMVGSDISLQAISYAQKIITSNSNLINNIEVRHQKDNANILKDIILPDEYFHFTMCNPPFHSSAEEAKKGTQRKLKNLSKSDKTIIPLELNFGGHANELWCNGGESLFIKRMIKQSIGFKKQVGWFTSLVSKKENLPKIYKQLNKLNTIHKTIEMSQGNKKSRFIAWKFTKE
ncbi:23S rRNA (adenine1618-N6)-methyltransferase [Aquimarina amphilecti]|uniref:Ribosomal RNA large subunit methyltransferase F n=1 Tax=Aquimarina amphilecti TaxID=1038014 RepID=A0A1H7HL32_AQUAM|nr:23S rRNA (adenine(1618)-N(6))-methyltransferase RlmF [Aquimarina amphilecti]SEK51113.1 23S rRNA (adenine1618-N6)-methyltransferase [Aquimarina amphilecti]